MEKDAFIPERTAVARFMARLYDRGLTTAGGGNISFRLSDSLFCITPTSLDKSCLNAKQIAIVTLDGTNLTPENNLSIETEMHRLILKARTDINAVVHAHPVYATAFTALETQDGQPPIDTHITAEGYYLLGDPVVVPYAKQGSALLAANMARASATSDVLLMENHGVATLAKTLLLAFEKIDVLDRATRMTFVTRTMENAGFRYRELTEDKRKDLRP